MVSLLTVLVALKIMAPHYSNQPGLSDQKQETVYDRVMRTGTLRCGYLAWKNFVDIDPNTGEFSGMTVDYMQALTQNLGLKLEWVEEVGRGDYPIGLQQGRYDAYCTALTATAERARVSDFIRPIAVEVFNIFVQNDVTRYDYNLDALNNPDVTFAATEGDIFTKIIRRHFPRAKLIELPQLTGDTDPLMHVKDGKADAVLMNAKIGHDFEKMNPKSIRQVKLAEPFRYIPVSIATKVDEYRFTKMLDVATMEILANGTINKILDRYDPDNQVYLRIAKPYQMNTQ